MSSIEKSIDVGVPASAAYAQWIEVEQFPKFMDGVMEVTRIDETHQHWRAKVAGREREWDAEVTEQVPGRRISWRSVAGAHQGGTVTFEPLDEESCRIDLRIDYDPEGFIEKIGDALGFVSGRVEEDLRRFKWFMEGREIEVAAWSDSMHDEK